MNRARLFASFALPLLFGAAAPCQGPVIRAVTSDRISRLLLVEDGGLDLGRVVLEYTPEPWAADTARRWRELPDLRRPIGAGDWSVLRSSVPVELDEEFLEPGGYYLGLSAEQDDWQLLLFEAGEVDEQRLTRDRLHEAAPFEVALEHSQVDAVVPLSIGMQADELTIAFGPHRLRCSLALQLSHHGLPDIGERLPADVAEWIETATAVEMIATEPTRAPEPPAADTFHGYPVRGRGAVPVATTGREIRRDVYEGIRRSDGSVADCFRPRHGLRVQCGDRVVDLVICYECSSMLVFVPGRDAFSVPTSDSVRDRVNRLFAAAGLRVAK